MSIQHLARPEIVAMKPYSSARLEASDEGVLLNANESPWALIEDEPETSGMALGGAMALNRYPQPQPAELVDRLASHYGLPADHLLLTRGSDEGIDLLLRIFCRPGTDSIIDCPPSFGMYRVAAQIQGARVIAVPRHPENLLLDHEAILEIAASDEPPRIIFLTSPANPTGDVVDPQFLEPLLQTCQQRSIVVVDEAYAEFCNEESFARWIPGHENLVVLRTLSKAFGSASLRCGVTLASAETIDLMRRVIAPYPLPGPIVSLALRLFQPDVLNRQQLVLRKLRDNKRRLVASLEGRSFVKKIWPGKANFVLLRIEDAAGLVEHCARRGVSIRGFASDPTLHDCVRISVGANHELDALDAALDEYVPARTGGTAANV